MEEWWVVFRGLIWFHLCNNVLVCDSYLSVELLVIIVCTFSAEYLSVFTGTTGLIQLLSLLMLASGKMRICVPADFQTYKMRSWRVKCGCGRNVISWKTHFVEIFIVGITLRAIYVRWTRAIHRASPVHSQEEWHWQAETTMPAPRHSVFYRPDALPDAQPTVSKHWRHRSTLTN